VVEAMYLNNVTGEFMRFKESYDNQIVIQKTGYIKGTKYELKKKFCKYSSSTGEEYYPSIVFMDYVYPDGDVRVIYSEGGTTYLLYKDFEEKELDYYYKKVKRNKL